MISISGASSMAQQFSPRDLLQTELQSQISTGEISSDDEEALSAALDAIDSQLAASRPEPGGKPPSPDEMQATIDDLITEQVASGDLTGEQAAELSELFEDTFAGGPGGPGGPPPSSGSESSDMLADFLAQLQNQSGSTSYAEDGSSSSSSLASVLFDISA